jgi:hypothetical protein
MLEFVLELVMVTTLVVMMYGIVTILLEKVEDSEE